MATLDQKPNNQILILRNFRDYLICLHCDIQSSTIRVLVIQIFGLIIES
jgi:hypothetical protein